MHDLRAAPFSLTYDTLVRAKVLARNARGWSIASDANTAGARIEVEPSAVTAPVRGVLTGPDQLDINWSSLVTPADGGSAVLSYHLQYDDGTAAGTWTDVIGLAPDSLLTTVIVSSGVISGTEYGFRVRARNIFGWGPYSTVVYIQAAREPDVPIAPVTSIDSVAGGVAIAWTAPDARGSDITEYLIEISDSTGASWPPAAACDGADATVLADLRCVVLMSTLTAAPYNYVFDAVVYVRVSAKNVYGFGVVSPASASTGAKIRVVPAQMAAPTEDASSTDVTVTMNWIALSGSNAGNSDVIAYSLYWDNGVTTGTADTELTDALVTSFTVNGVTGGLAYRFRVRARNIYGYGPYSVETTVVPDDAPGKADIPTVALDTVDPTAVTVTWALPNEHSSTITAYEVLFLKANGDYVTELTTCDGTDATVVLNRACTVPMSTIRTLTVLPRDSLIRVRVRAFNAKGSGQYSEINTAGARIETEPTNLSVVSIDVPSTFNDQTKVVWTALTGSSRGG